MSKTSRPWRFPKVLADEISAAFRGVAQLDAETKIEYVARYRRNRMRMIAHHGISGSSVPVPNEEPIPAEYIFPIGELVGALDKLRAYCAGGAEDYLSDDVIAAASREVARRPRNRSTKEDYGEVIEYLVTHGYETSDNKKAIRRDAVERFDLGDRTVSRIWGTYKRAKQDVAT